MTQDVMESGRLGRHDRPMEFSANTDPIAKLRLVPTASAVCRELMGLWDDADMATDRALKTYDRG
jgi:hypothetical protein